MIPAGDGRTGAQFSCCFDAKRDSTEKKKTTHYSLNISRSLLCCQTSHLMGTLFYQHISICIHTTVQKLFQILYSESCMIPTDNASRIHKRKKRLYIFIFGLLQHIFTVPPIHIQTMSKLRFSFHVSFRQNIECHNLFVMHCVII